MNLAVEFHCFRDGKVTKFTSVGHNLKWTGQSLIWVGHSLPGLILEPPLQTHTRIPTQTYQYSSNHMFTQLPRRFHILDENLDKSHKL